MKSLPFSHSSATLFAKSTAPSPPFSQCFDIDAFTPFCWQNFITSSTSLSVSKTKWLIATVTGKPNFWIFSICLSKFTNPFFTASIFSFLSSSLLTPPCIFKALIVATITTQLGFNPDFLHLISKNFSAPRSAPNPASVTT